MDLLISIITVSYNAVKTIEQTILSIINQTYDNIEYIIIDGGSTDGTIEVIKKYESKIAYWVSEPDKGIYDAMNKGLKKVNGELVGIINADDWLEERALDSVVSLYKNGMVIYHGDMRAIDLDRGFFYIAKAPKETKKLNRGMIINHPATFVNKEVYDKIGKFSTEFKIAGDWDFITRCFIANVEFVQVNSILSNFRLGGTSGAVTEELLEEMHLVRRKRGFYCWIDWYYYFDRLKYKILGKYLYKLYLLKKRLLNG